MDLIEKALQIALKAYAGRKDKAGKTYILHPLRVMHRMETDTARAVALLHDVIEDSDMTAADLLDEGMPAPVVEAVQCLTRCEGESYDDFITRVSANALAAAVKVADIEDNIDVLRLERLTDKDLDRVARYHAAWHRLTSRD